jgi:hypothetical protein
VKHAGPAALDDLEDVLDPIRSIPGIRERSRGVFYWKGTAFLHFHEDPEGPFADLRTWPGWTRVRVRTKGERRSLVSRAGRSAKKAP